MSLSVDTHLHSVALNSKRPREYIPTEMLEYLIKLKFDRQVKVETEMKYVYCIDKRAGKMFITSLSTHLNFIDFSLVLELQKRSIFLSTQHVLLYTYQVNRISSHFHY